MSRHRRGRDYLFGGFSAERPASHVCRRCFKGTVTYRGYDCNHGFCGPECSRDPNKNSYYCDSCGDSKDGIYGEQEPQGEEHERPKKRKQTDEEATQDHKKVPRTGGDTEDGTVGEQQPHQSEEAERPRTGKQTEKETTQDHDKAPRASGNSEDGIVGEQQPDQSKGEAKDRKQTEEEAAQDQDKPPSL